MTDVVVIGGGAAGMMAAIRAAQRGFSVILVEHNEKLGKKLYITGKGRCNVTNACETEDIFSHVSRNSKFLYSAVYSLTNYAVMDFFEKAGIPLKTERGMRVFPVSDHASDIIKALRRTLEQLSVRVLLQTQAKALLCKDGRAYGVRVQDRKTKEQEDLMAGAVIVATGGISYPSTGSDGSGFELCRKIGLTTTEMRPSLVPFETKEAYINQLQGLSLKNVELSIFSGKKKLFSEFGEMLFTHFGISGPLVLSASSRIADRYWKEELSFTIDLKPALSHEQLDKRIRRDFMENQNRHFSNAVGHLLPKKLIPVVIELSGIDPDKTVNSITKEERRAFLEVLKGFPGTITGLRGYEEAIITRGGISVREVNPSTMESKKVENLYICGEMLDCDAVTGGFNLQIAWSTGFLAGDSCLA